ncbi:MAG: hypothetical protein J0H98_07265 [Solirubrobacterales bacterium]|nr:hypothetical protein [Solirubrobacterales bacterium]
MTTTVTEKTQRIEALKNGNRVQVYRAGQLRRLATLGASLEAILLDPNMAPLELGQVLMAIPSQRTANRSRPGILPKSIVQAREISQKAEVRSGRPIGTLTEPSRKAVLRAAFELIGHRAWIFQSDDPPKSLRARKVTIKRNDQSRVALEKANKVRIERSQQKARLRAGEIDLEEALDLAAFRTWQLGKLVVHLRRTTMNGVAYLDRMAPTAAKKVLAKNRISPLTKIGDLSADSKKLLVMLFAEERFCKPSMDVIA